MNQEQVKSMLLEIEKTELEFTLIFSGKESKKVNGLYKPNTHEIILHNHNFKTDNQLIYTAIHEFAHHLINEEQEKSAISKKTARVHTNEFWARFHGLLEVAEQKGFYGIGVDASPELLEITENIKKNYLEKIAILSKELGEQLAKAHDLCIASNVRYEDYTDRYLQISKKEVTSLSKIKALDISPSFGYENIKMISAISSPDKMATAFQQLSEGKSPASVRFAMKKKDEDTDKTVILEKEKTHIEKTIIKLSTRLEEIKEIILNGFSLITEKQCVMHDRIGKNQEKERKAVEDELLKTSAGIFAILQHEISAGDYRLNEEGTSFMPRIQHIQPARLIFRPPLGVSNKITLNPSDATACYVRGSFYYRNGAYEKAIIDCNKIIEFHPDNSSAYRLRANVYGAMGNREKAFCDNKMARDIEEKLISWDSVGIGIVFVFWQKL